METETREQRRSALDQFAETANLPTTTAGAGAVIGQSDIIHGAQQVAVHRDERRVFERLRASAAAMGEFYYYRFPVRNRKENRTDWIEGPSIKLANDLARIYGNNETDCRVQDLGDSWIFYGRFIDLETGYSLTRPFQQRKSAAKLGGDDDARRLDIAFQIGASKAIRNVVVNALQTFSEFTFQEAKHALVERIGQNLEEYRSRTIERIGALVDIARVEAVVGRPRKEWLAPDVARVIAMMRAVQDGMSSLNETFPPLQEQQEGGSQSVSETLDAFVDAGTDQETAAPSPSPQGDELPLDADPAAGAADDTVPQSLAADMFETIARRMAAAQSEAAVHQVWEQLELDAYFEGDKPGRDKAWKIASKRLKELRQ